MVDMQAIKSYSIGFGIVIIAVSLVTVLLDQLNQTSGLSNSAKVVIQNGSSLIGQLITTWGSIILLGIVVVAVFVGIFVALNYMQSSGGRR